jgi:hypothetical protein
MKTLLAALIAFAVAGSGCIVVHHPRGARSGVSSQRCPPGHQWSDGRCHSTGHGGDRAARGR